MFNFISILWIILTLVVVGIPTSIGLYFIFKFLIKSLNIFIQKINDIKALNNMREDILKQRSQESEYDIKIWDDNKLVEDNISNKINEKLENNNSDQYSKNNDLVKSSSDDVLLQNSDELNVDKTDVNKDIAKYKKILEKIQYEASVLKKEGKIDLYEKKIIEGLAIDPDNVDLKQMLADLYFTIGSHNKALSLLKKIIEIQPQNHNAIWQIGEIYLISGDFETSEILIDKAINIKPSNPKYYISLVELYYNTDRKQEAINIMEKVIRLRPTNASYIYTLANIYDELGDKVNARKYYFRVLEYEPSNEKAKKKLRDLDL